MSLHRPSKVHPNGRKPIPASSLPPNRIFLYPGERPTVVCADCDTWRTLQRGSVITPHSPKDEEDRGERVQLAAGKRELRTRCEGSGQIIKLDISPAEWIASLIDAITQTKHRRTTKVSLKPNAGRKTPTPPSTKNAFNALHAHVKQCTACTNALHAHVKQPAARKYRPGEKPLPCQDGAILAHWARAEKFSQERARTEAARNRKTQWDRATGTPADRQQTAKRSGTKVEELNNNCKLRPAGAVSEYRGPHVPLKTLRAGA